MTQEELLLHEYKICHDGYISRDGLVPTEFSQMLNSFLILLAVATASKILVNSHMSVGVFLFFLISIVGFSSLFAFAVNIESKASCKRALRGRMAIIEDHFASIGLPIDYWKSIVNRDKSWIEKIYKTKEGSRGESGSASGFFVVSSWVLVCVWVILVTVMFFGDIQFPHV